MFKMASVNVIGHFEGMYSTANITITHQTRCKPFLIQPAILIMEKKLSTISPIEIQINGFNFFNHGQSAKTIYAQIELTPCTENWFRLLKKQLGIRVKNFVPHISIVKNIPVQSFNKLWPKFQNREYIQTFTIDRITVLHRETYVEYCEWRIYKELFFANKLKEMF